MRDGDWLVGWGTATGTWGAFQAPAGVKITMRADGTAHIGSATADIGPGTYTMATIIAAEYLGIVPEKIKFELGDTKFPRAPSQGGSVTTASVGSAIYGAAMKIKQKLFDLAVKDTESRFAGAKINELEMLNGNLCFKKDKTKAVSIAEILKKNNMTEIIEVHRETPFAGTQELHFTWSRSPVCRSKSRRTPGNRKGNQGRRSYCVRKDHESENLALTGNWRSSLGHRNGLNRGNAS